MNRKPVKTEKPKLKVKEVVKKTGRTPSDFDVFQLDNEGDTDGTEISLEAVIDRTDNKETLFFRAVEKKRDAGR